MRCPALAGRVAECAAIDEVLAGATAGRGSVVALEGDAGVGNSRLVRAAAERANTAGMTALSGRATPGVAAAFRPLAEALLSASRDRLLAGLISRRTRPRWPAWCPAGPSPRRRGADPSSARTVTLGRAPG
jgi:hypothetical protein